MIDIQLKEKVCKFSSFLQPSEIVNINWNSYITNKFLNSFLPKYGIISEILQVKHDDLASILPDGTIRLNFTCLCKVFSPEPGDVIKFNITNILEPNQYCYEQSNIIVGVLVDHLEKQIDDLVVCIVKTSQYVDNKFIIIATEIKK